MILGKLPAWQSLWRRGGRLRTWIVATVLLTSALVLSKNKADPDLWGHVRYGRDLLVHGLPAGATYTYTAAGHRWINHELLSELGLAVGFRYLGSAILLSLKSFLGGLLLWRMIRRATQAGVSLEVACGTALLVALNLMHFWNLRPQLFSFLLLAVEVEILAGAFAGWEGRRHFGGGRRSGAGARSSAELPPVWRLWPVPLLFAVWANTHGAFVAGLAILVAYVALRTVEILAEFGRGGLAAAGLLAAITVASLAATWLNPYGWQLHAWLFGSLSQPRPEIIEWLAPEVLSQVWWPFWLAALFTVAALATSRQPRDMTQSIILLLVLWQAASHRRHIALFAILFGYWMPVHLADGWSRLRRAMRAGGAIESTNDLASPAASRRLRWGLIACCLVLTTLLVDQLRYVRVRRDGYPVAAVQFMADHGLHGKLVVRFKWAQYALAALGTRQGPGGTTVAFDGRFRTCYPQNIVDMYFDFAAGMGDPATRNRGEDSPEYDPTRILDDRTPELVLMDRRFRHALDTVARQEGKWVLLYQDELAQLWGLSTRYDDPASPYYFPPAQRQIGNARQTGMVAWPAFPVTHERSSRPALPQHAIQSILLTNPRIPRDD